MQSKRVQANKNPKTDWVKYQIHKRTREQDRQYDIPPELEDELLRNRLLLKRRAWRGTKDMRPFHQTAIHEPRSIKLKTMQLHAHNHYSY